MKNPWKSFRSLPSKRKKCSFLKKNIFHLDCKLLKDFQGFFTSSILLLRNYHCFVTARFHFGQICCARHILHVASKLEGNRRPKQAKNAHVVHNCTETVDAIFYLPSDNPVQILISRLVISPSPLLQCWAGMRELG